MTARYPIWLCLILACVAQPAPRAPAADYYVDPRAGEDDNDGSIGAPWKHLSIAGRRLRPGDAVHLRGGTYRDDSLFTTTDGTKEAPITVRSYPGENLLILEAPISFAEGEPVSLSWDGAAPDLGLGSVRTGSKQAKVRRAEMPQITKPVMFHTPEADAILSALEVFPADNPWNQVVSDWPLHPNSAKIIASIGVDKPLRYNTDMAFILVPPDQKRVDVKIVSYPEESDPGPFPVPDEMPIEGWPAYYEREAKELNLSLEDVQRDKLNRGGDRHGIIVDPVNRMLYEFFVARKIDDGWQAAQASVFDLKTNALRPDGWTSADAAGLPIFPAVVRYDELKRGKVEHAMRVTVRKTRRGYVAPATHFASRHKNEDYPRMGERIRLRSDFDISGFSPEVRTILNGLKSYGMFVADNGIEWAISVAPDPRIGVLHEELRRVKGSAFEVVVAPR